MARTFLVASNEAKIKKNERQNEKYARRKRSVREHRKDSCRF